MITKQKIYQNGDEICLRNTVDVSSAVDAARRVNEIDNGGWAGDKNERIQLMGFIPPEFWGFDPWLICAKRAELISIHAPVKGATRRRRRQATG